MKTVYVIPIFALILLSCSSGEIKKTERPKFDFKAYEPITMTEIIKIAKNIHEVEGDGGIAIINKRQKVKYKLIKLPTKVDEYGKMTLGALTKFLRIPVDLEDVFGYQLVSQMGKFKVQMYFQSNLVKYTVENSRSELYFYVLYASYNDFDKTIALLVNAVNNQADEEIIQRALQ